MDFEKERDCLVRNQGSTDTTWLKHTCLYNLTWIDNIIRRTILQLLAGEVLSPYATQGWVYNTPPAPFLAMYVARQGISKYPNWEAQRVNPVFAPILSSTKAINMGK
jgi:hypothetical protein